MALNPMAATMAPLGQGAPVPSTITKPYPQLGPAQGGSMVPQANPGPGMDPSAGGGGEDDQDKLATVVRLATAAGVQNPNDLGNFLKGLGFQTAARLAKPAQPRGITDNPATGPGGGPPMPPPPMPPAMGAAPPRPPGMMG